MINAEQMAVMQNRGGVVNVVLLVNKADDGGNAPRIIENPLQHEPIFRDELRLEQQIERRIAGNRQFRERDNIRAFLLRPLNPLDNFRRVAFQIADGGVHLRHGNAYLSHNALLFE